MTGVITINFVAIDFIDIDCDLNVSVQKTLIF